MVNRTPTSLLLEPQTPKWAQRFVLRLQNDIQDLKDSVFGTGGAPGSANGSPFAPAAAVAFRGVLATMTTDLTAQNLAVLNYSIPFNAELYDTDNLHSPSVNNTRITIPAGVSKVKLRGSCRVNLGTSGEFYGLQIFKNGSGVYPGFTQSLVTFGAAGIVIGNISSPVLPVVAGDYFTLNTNVQADTSVTVQADTTWFALEVVA